MEIKNFDISGVSSNLQLGKVGFRLKVNGTGIEAKDASDLELVNLSILSPTSDNHAATRAYVDAGDSIAKTYAPGTFTLATEQFAIFSRHLKLTTTQRAEIQGTSTLRIT